MHSYVLTWADEFHRYGLYASDTSTLCKHCNCKVSYERPDTVLKHVKRPGDLPSVRTLREKLIPKLYESHFNKVKDMERNGFAIIFKFLTQQTTGVPEVMVASVSYLDKADATSYAQAITVHYVI
ncbi:hypothetical protein PR048_001655 [Dryococelus australis]|uniref:Uncharacterized protein n=1 Tax=Dryococelus australis TaxID=614101 RepID=A0ABQ9II34_9NEOP|nr:hypothetical protein PR048_001655 [Dryococelus australis]